MRRAMNMAVNKDEIVKAYYNGNAELFAYPQHPDYGPYFEPLKDMPASVQELFKYDPAKARKLLAEAGYPDGFGLTVHAPNNRYVNDDQIAQVVAQMLSRIGVQVRVEALPINVYLPKARNGDFSFAMLGWGSFSGDLALRSLLASPNADKGFGTWNWSRYSNAKVDQLLEQGFASVDEKKREALAREAAGLALRDVGVLPLHHQMASWAMKKPLRYVGRTDEYTFAQHVLPK